MIIDSSGSLHLPQTVDIKIGKTIETEEPWAVEDLEKGNDSTLDSNKQNIGLTTLTVS